MASSERRRYVLERKARKRGFDAIAGRKARDEKVERLEVVGRGDVRRAKLYYLRGRVGKRARVAERRWGIEDELVLAAEEEPEALDSEGVAQSEAAAVPPAEDGDEAEEADVEAGAKAPEAGSATDGEEGEQAEGEPPEEAEAPAEDSGDGEMKQPEAAAEGGDEAKPEEPS